LNSSLLFPSSSCSITRPPSSSSFLASSITFLDGDFFLLLVNFYKGGMWSNTPL
jgi:hypothetical protein